MRTLPLVLLGLSTIPGIAQIPMTNSPLLTNSSAQIGLPPSNSVAHMSTQGTDIWIGSSKGLARSLDGARSWESFRGVPEFPTPGIFSVAVRGNTIFTSAGFTKEVNDQSVQTGAGYTYSTNYGTSWTFIPQTLDALDDSLVPYGINTVKFLPIVVPEQNVTFDAALSDSFVWIASWSSGLRRSSNFGQTWERIVLPSDNRSTISPDDPLGNYVVDPRQHNNFLVFSVFVQDDSTIWAGTAGGVNRSTDAGRSWVKFSTLNQASPILGNWVIAIGGQQLSTGYRIWITNWQADLDPNEQFGISYSDDGGRIWKNALHGLRAYDFAFKDSIAYVATDDGLYRSADGGLSWTSSGTIVDPNSRNRLTTRTFFSVGVVADTVYAGTGGGIVKTTDSDSQPFGYSWEVFRTYRPVGNSNTTYAYPNPFSPDDENVRFHYSTQGRPATVTVEIFDFSMHRVRTVVKDAQRFGTGEYDEIWNGRDDNNVQVANGVYFYRVVISDDEPIWGKVMVLQ
ncbi:MAG: hypothetical protein ACKVRP_10940 [Bacteroidota bacterium]